MNKFSTLVVRAILTALFLGLVAPMSHAAPVLPGENPIIRDAFTADPAALVDGDTVYLYVGHDEAKGDEMFTMREWLYYSSKDMKNWKAHGPIMRATDFKWAVGDAWAAQVVKKGGKYYFYTTVQHDATKGGKAIGVAVSDSPTGPFKDARGSALITDDMTPSDKPWNDIDPTVFVDDDGTPWLAWGNPYLYLVKLKPNMLELDGAIQKIDLPNYTEGPWLHKRGNLYYLTYAAFAHQGTAEKICYATAPTMAGPWTYQGILTGFAQNSYTIHPAIIDFKGQSYLFYHNATLTLGGESGAIGRRSVCAEYLYYNADGTIKPIVQTTEGVSAVPMTPTSTQKTTELASNPVIWADVPDLAMIRVGDTYYMSSTTMHMSPGLPIMKSKDLVNWEMVGYAYDTLGDNDMLTLQNGKSAYGAGSWASSLRYHEGTFYVTTFASTTGKTHVYKTKDIEKGPWVESTFSPALHDHSLFFDDDGRVYMIYGGGDLRLIELTADATAIKPGGVNQVIVPNASLVAGPNVGLNAEGSQMLKVNGKYYLFNITWPKNDMRTEIVHRADKITGPYQGRVVLKDKGVAQGSLIDTPKGDWYAYMFQDHGAVGRIPFLVPVKWEDGWPVLGVDGKVPETLDIPTQTPTNSGIPTGIVASDEFDRRPGQPLLPLAWQWNHNPDNAHWSLTQRPGFLRLTTGRVDPDFLSALNTLTQRTFGPQSSATVSVDVSNMKDGDFAGLSALQKRYGLVGVTINGNTKSLVMVSAESDAPVELQRVPLTQNTVFLKVECDFKDKTDKAYFSYSLDGNTWTPIGKPLQMAYTLPHFMGYRFGLFNYATKETGGYTDFDFFRISDKITQR
ncbi:hypothetical protein EON83_02615 [bacterium]|nr:MAG: hypothetical protein EON83_02615 [bacterium]